MAEYDLDMYRLSHGWFEICFNLQVTVYHEQASEWARNITSVTLG